MKLRPKSISKLALFLVLSVLTVAFAEVKLRIYLKDGTLQSGTLVTESKESFVILTKQDRVEIPKDKIMFVNGKTIKQWEAHPDKNYQTEIMPDKVPDPSYVNGMAPPPAAPKPAPVVQPVQPIEKVLPTAKAEEAPAPPVQAAPPAPPASVVPPPAPPVVEEKPKPAVQAAEPVPAPKPEARLRRKLRHRKAPLAAPVSAPAVVAAVPKVEKKQAPPRGFDRKNFSDYHYQMAVRFLEDGEKGRAMQELHMSVILDRGNEPALLLLGRLYMQSGVFGQAEKYFNYPVLRKKDDVKKLVQEIQNSKARQEKDQWMTEAEAAGGVVAMLPALFLIRRFRRKKAARHVISADAIQAEPAIEMEPAMPAPALAPEEKFADAVKEVLGDEISIVPIGKYEAEVTFPTSPVVQPPAEKIKPPEPVAPPPEPERAPEPVFARKEPPPLPPRPEPEKAPVSGGNETPPAPPAPRVPAPAWQDDLSTTQLVEHALHLANEFAMAGDIEPARRQYKTVLALHAENVEAHLGLAYLCSLQEKWDLALQYYQRSVTLDPASADAHYGVGRSLAELGRFDEAAPNLRKALEIDPTFADARDTLTALGQAA